MHIVGLEISPTNVFIIISVFVCKRAGGRFVFYGSIGIGRCVCNCYV